MAREETDWNKFRNRSILAVFMAAAVGGAGTLFYSKFVSSSISDLSTSESGGYDTQLVGDHIVQIEDDEADFRYDFAHSTLFIEWVSSEMALAILPFNAYADQSHIDAARKEGCAIATRISSEILREYGQDIDGKWGDAKTNAETFLKNYCRI